MRVSHIVENERRPFFKYVRDCINYIRQVQVVFRQDVKDRKTEVRAKAGISKMYYSVAIDVFTAQFVDAATGK